MVAIVQNVESAGRRLKRLHRALISRTQVSQVTLIQQIELALLTASDQQRGTGNQHWAGRTEVQIVFIHVLKILGSEPVRQCQIRSEFDKAVSQITTVRGVFAERAVSDHEVDVSARIGGRPVSRLPNAPLLAVRSRAE